MQNTKGFASLAKKTGYHPIENGECGPHRYVTEQI